MADLKVPAKRPTSHNSELGEAEGGGGGSHVHLTVIRCACAQHLRTTIMEGFYQFMSIDARQQWQSFTLFFYIVNQPGSERGTRIKGPAIAGHKILIDALLSRGLYIEQSNFHFNLPFSSGHRMKSMFSPVGWFPASYRRWRWF